MVSHSPYLTLEMVFIGWNFNNKMFGAYHITLVWLPTGISTGCPPDGFDPLLPTIQISLNTKELNQPKWWCTWAFLVCLPDVFFAISFFPKFYAISTVSESIYGTASINHL